jgi:hypothetical protein
MPQPPRRSQVPQPPQLSQRSAAIPVVQDAPGNSNCLRCLHESGGLKRIEPTGCPRCPSPHRSQVHPATRRVQMPQPPRWSLVPQPHGPPAVPGATATLANSGASSHPTVPNIVVVPAVPGAAASDPAAVQVPHSLPSGLVSGVSLRLPGAASASAALNV